MVFLVFCTFFLFCLHICYFCGKYSLKQDRISYLKLNPIDEPLFKIKCSVRLKEVPDGVPGPFSEISKNFFAGIQVSKPFITNKSLIL